MTFHALDASLALITQLRAPHARIAAQDPDLARQLRRAAHSIALNVSEARERAGKDRAHLFRVAFGSAAETRTALEIAIAWSWVPAEDAADALATLDRLCAMLWRLTR